MSATVEWVTGLQKRIDELERAIRQAIDECDAFESRNTIRTGLALALEDDG